ncbi:hypothetical protein, partial [Frankia nepalensis]|uniref:hypothetical protein n=1 Tax=Frankia nepalensis TaxID=1836974 RepID=UPI001931D55D
VPPPGLAAGGLVSLTSRPDPFAGDSDAARAAGAGLGRELVGAALRPRPDPAVLADLATRLRAGAADPELVAGFVEAVGAARLAAVLRRAEGVPGGGFRIDATAGYQVHATRGGPRPAADVRGWRLPPAVGDALTAALGAALATFSRAGRLTADWLGRFNARGEPGAAEVTLLGPLLGHGRFAPATLRLLGDALFAGTAVGGDRYGVRPAPLGQPGTAGEAGAVRGVIEITDVGLFGDEPTGPRRARYAAALLRAIADTPAIAASFAADHVEKILAGSRLGALPAPIRHGVPEPVARAWEHLVARAGGAEARRADPAGAATFAARLALTVYLYRGAHEDPAHRRDTSWPPPPGMRAAFGEVVRTWRAELYASVVSLLPAGTVPRPAPGAGPGATGPALGPWGRRPAGSRDAARIPAEVWAALLGEALAAGGPGAAALAADAALAAQELEQSVWAATRGYRGDGHVAYPASPRALGRLQQAALLSFFLATLADTAAALTLRAELQAGDEARRLGLMVDELAAIARAIRPTDPIGTLTGLAVTVPVADAAAAARPTGQPVPSRPALAAIEAVLAAGSVAPGWRAAYRTSATAVWLRRADDPILPVEVTDAAGHRRRYTGDPRADGFITGAADDFLDPSGDPLDEGRMSPAQRGAYLRWLASPAIVANNDNIPVIPVLAARPGD